MTVFVIVYISQWPFLQIVSDGFGGIIISDPIRMSAVLMEKDVHFRSNSYVCICNAMNSLAIHMLEKLILEETLILFSTLILVVDLTVYIYLLSPCEKVK